MSATLKLPRKAPVMEVIHRGTFDVLVDGKRVGSIESDGDTIETPVAPGRHTLQVREGRYSSRELSFQVTDAKSSASGATDAGFGRSGSRHWSCRGGRSSSVRSSRGSQNRKVPQQIEPGKPCGNRLASDRSAGDGLFAVGQLGYRATRYCSTVVIPGG
jgi:hypothetical protein